ncbi:MAG: M20/M25/M40 family metallo-hydrolase [Cyclobacteriaceae bacterium]|nr:M20/M25/M40 family metallo-hydrolase [Cyclobacteriaceae bacterium]UYN85997.1 MAG: M20/M25/M40 family metallo-hydrolase [Cyclobacteriaceae bacterium]
MKTPMKKLLFTFIILILLISCGEKVATFNREDGLASITVAGLETHLKKLSSDEFMGRMPFTEGERKTLAYLQEQYKALGLEPGNGESYLQEVPMVEISATAAPAMEVKSKKGSFKLEGLKDYVIWTERTQETIDLKDDDLIFAGFGIVAPEYNWNDYAGLDVKDKVVLVMVNDPGFGSDNATLFKGNTMTYYGRWTYKFEEAARQGAKGLLIIHDDVPAGYGFWVVQNSWNASKLYLDTRDKNPYFCATVGWVSNPTAKKLFEAAGLDWATSVSAARQPGFKGMPMNLKLSTTLSVKSKYDKTHNVIGKITGTKQPDEYIIYSTHWDHLGIGKADEKGDTIYNGALDNASGTAGMLELIKAFKSMKAKPNRTIIFLAVTAEEQGLWGSEYYAQNPIYPKEKTVANINMDGINPYGKMKDIVVVGLGQSDLEDYLNEEAKAVGRYTSPEPNPVAGYYFRSDHFCFAKVGIPALYTGTGIDHFEKGAEYGKQLQDEYVAKYYHKPSDEYDPSRWNLEGAVDDLKLLFNVGKKLAFETTWPQWKEGSEFKTIRDGYMK